MEGNNKDRKKSRVGEANRSGQQENDTNKRIRELNKQLEEFNKKPRMTTARQNTETRTSSNRASTNARTSTSNNSRARNIGSIDSVPRTGISSNRAGARQIDENKLKQDAYQEAYLKLVETQERENRRREIEQYTKESDSKYSEQDRQREEIRRKYREEQEQKLRDAQEKENEQEDYRTSGASKKPEKPETSDLESRKTENSENLSRKEKRALKKSRKRAKRRQRSFVGRLINCRQNLHTAEFIILMPFAFILDILGMLKNIILSLVVILIITGTIGAIFVWSKVKPYYDEYSAFAKQAVSECDITTFMMQEPTYIYDSNGDLLARLRGDQDSIYLPYEEIPTHVINAFVAVEDRTFWENPGVDLKGIIRVGVAYLKTHGEEKHGASTITQQLARTIFLTREVSLERKGKEIMISMELTNKFTKKQIMEFYVNDVCFANAFYGIEAAAKGYFNKRASELTLSEIAYLCAIPNSPEYYNPYKYPERAVERRDKILVDMLELGYISNSEYLAAKNQTITIEKPEYEFDDYMSTYAIDCAVRYMMEQQGFELRYKFDNMDDYKTYKEAYNDTYDTVKDKLYTGGYKVYTTLDPDVQANMQEILDRNLSFDTNLSETGIYELQGALTVIDNDTGKVLAVVGGRSQEESEGSKIQSLNRAFQSFRQPGSSIKPLAVYTPSLTMGYGPDTIVTDISVSEAKKKGVDAQALSGKTMTLRSALENSRNGVAWRIFDDITPSYGLSFLEQMRFSRLCPDDYYNATSLGGMTYGVNTVEMAGAYATLVNHGYFREPTCLKRILDRNEQDVYESDTTMESVYDEMSADMMIDMMEGVLTRGTAAKLGWGKVTKMAAACKTGTTNDSKDGWLCGVTPYYTIAVWVGYDQPRTLSNLYGGTYPGNIWKEAMLKMIEGKDVIEEFEKSEWVDTYDGDFSEDALNEKYLPGRSPDEELSSGYTVADYREDRVKGEQLPGIINQINSLDRNSEQFAELLNNYYSQGQQVINSVYSRKYKAELTGQLDAAYNGKLNGQ